MTLDLRPILRGEITRMPLDFPVTVESPDGAPLISGVTFTGDLRLWGEITNRGGYMRLVATVELPYAASCARCLTEITDVFTMPFERTVVTEGTLTEEQLEDNIDEYVVTQDGFLSIDDAVCEALLLSFPLRFLCREDCPGLCPQCGKPLSDGPCGCTKKEIDPRWAILSTLRFDEDDDQSDSDPT